MFVLMYAFEFCFMYLFGLGILFLSWKLLHFVCLGFYYFLAFLKEKKNLTAFEHREKLKKRLTDFLLHNIDIAVVFECLCHLRAHYPIQSPDVYIG